VHCATSVLNAGRIENTKGDFMFYWEGMTESVCRVLEEVDRERVAVAEKLGIKLMSNLDFLRKVYPLENKGVDLRDFLTHSSVHGGHGGPDAPKDLHYRYISEDVPNGLVPTSEYGKLTSVPTPAIDSIILLASILNSTDYRKEGRTLDKMGLSEKSCSEILEFIE